MSTCPKCGTNMRVTEGLPCSACMHFIREDAEKLGETQKMVQELPSGPTTEEEDESRRQN